MISNTEQRRLAAIVFTDMVGYSALTQRNETLALELLEEHQRILRQLFPKFDGREIETTGDGFLVEFGSSLAAAPCAIEIQRALSTRNLSVTADRQIHVRIGIHVGDVVHKDGHVLGDGVNIAARLQPLAEPGGICISADVARQIQHNLEAEVVPVGEVALKNIRLPMEVWRIVLPWEKPAIGARLSGEKAKSDAGSVKAGPPTGGVLRRRLRVGAPAMVLLAPGLAIVLGWWMNHHRPTLAPGSPWAQPRIDSLAVKPVDDYSGDANQAYLSDGMTEALCSALGNLSALRVPGRSTVMRYKHSSKSIQEMAHELKVGAILESSVQRAGNRLLITVQLIQAATDRHLWATNYDRDLGDFFKVQSEVARAIADEVQIRLTAEDQTRLARARSGKPEAIEACLLGRYHWAKYTTEDSRKAIDYLKQAVEIDPQYAMAYAHLADAYRATFLPLPPSRAQALQRDAASKALELDPALAEAHVQMAYVKLDLDWDWPGAEREFQQAIALNPNHALAHDEYAFYLFKVGRFEEGIAQQQQALHLDPLSTLLNNDLAWVYYYTRKVDLAIEQSRKTIAFDANFPLGYETLGLALAQRGQFPAALEALQKASNLDTNGFVLGGLGSVAAMAGNRDQASRIIEELKAQETEVLGHAGSIAMILAALDEKDESFLWLQKAFKERAYLMTILKVEPSLDNLRADPRFADLLKKVGLDK